MTCWNKDAVYALSSYKTLAWPVGAWPIEDDTLYSRMRWLFAIVSEVRKSIQKIFILCVFLYIYIINFLKKYIYKYL